jgi:hypothetical protein
MHAFFFLLSDFLESDTAFSCVFELKYHLVLSLKCHHFSSSTIMACVSPVDVSAGEYSSASCEKPNNW